MAREMAPDDSISLPGREDQLRDLIIQFTNFWEPLHASYACIPMVNHGPGFGKTAFLLLCAEALHHEIVCLGKPPPIVAMCGFDKRMSKKIEYDKHGLTQTQALGLRLFWGGLNCMGFTPLLEWQELVERLEREGGPSFLRGRSEWHSRKAVDWLQIVYPSEEGPYMTREVIVAVDDLLKGVDDGSGWRSATELTYDIWDQRWPPLSNSREIRHVLISTTTREGIKQLTTSGWHFDLYMNALSVCEGAAVAKQRLRLKGALSGDPKQEENVNFYASLIRALTGGHPRTLVRAVDVLCDAAAQRGTSVDMMDSTSVLRVLASADVLDDDARLISDELLELILLNRVWEIKYYDRVCYSLGGGGKQLPLDVVDCGELVMSSVDYMGEKTLDVIPLVLFDREAPAHHGSGALWLLDTLLHAGEIKASDLGARASAFFTACALSHARDSLDKVLPAVCSQLEQCTGVGWSSRSDYFDTTKLSLHLDWSTQADAEDSGCNESQDPWGKLCEYFKRTSTDLPRSAEHWNVRLVLAPPGCHLLDYFVHFYMCRNDDTVADVVVAVKVKTVPTDADAIKTIISEMEAVNRFLKANQAGLGASVGLCFHVGNALKESELSSRPKDVQVITGKDFREGYFLPALVGLLSICNSSEIISAEARSGS
eukprot:6214730-Pleurochrysis_carterae.AAC.2